MTTIDTSNHAGEHAGQSEELGEGISPLFGEIRQLAEDARSLAEAELAYQTSRAKVAGIGARGIALYGLLALFFVFFALGGLTVGLLLALTPLVTAWGATAIVVGVLLLGAVLCALGALRTWRHMRDALTGQAK